MLEGEIYEIWVNECGTTFNADLFWEDVFFTTEPEHVKVCFAPPFISYCTGTDRMSKAILATDFPNFVKGANV